MITAKEAKELIDSELTFERIKAKIGNEIRISCLNGVNCASINTTWMQEEFLKKIIDHVGRVGYIADVSVSDELRINW